jgi:hypothetical protein
MDSPERAWSAIVHHQNCSLRESRGLPIRVVMGISRVKSIAFGKCYQSPQDGVRYTVTIFVLRDPWKAAFFATYLANLIEVLAAKGILPITFHFRMGAHFGNVYRFFDPGRNDWNYIGDGINGGQRVLGAVGKDTDDVLYISAELRQTMVKQTKPQHFPAIVEDAHNRGRKADKHGNPWRVYEINHTSLMTQYDRFIHLDTLAMS